MAYNYTPKNLTRYMGFTKFASMIELGLFIPKATLFDDKLEGIMQFSCDKAAPKSVSMDDLLAYREWIYVSCWFDDRHESHAMWQVYGAGTESIAVQTTALELVKGSWTLSDKPLTYMDNVRYVRPDEPSDFKSQGVTRLNDNEQPVGFIPAYAAHSHFMKHKGYEFEKEFRLVAVDPNAKTLQKNPKAGLNFPPDVTRQLIKKIFIHPLAPQWFEDLVKRTAERYEIFAPIERSSLSHSKLIKP